MASEIISKVDSHKANELGAIPAVALKKCATSWVRFTRETPKTAGFRFLVCWKSSAVAPVSNNSGES